MTKTTTKRAPRSLEQIMAAKKRRTTEQVIILDPEPVEAWHEAREAAEKAEVRVRIAENNPKATAEQRAEAKREADRLRRAADKAEKGADEASQLFRFQAIGGEALEALMMEHRPTPKELSEHQADQKRQGLQAGTLPYSKRTFPPALLAASAVEPVMDEAGAAKLWASDAFSDGERTALFQAAWTVNQLV